MTRTLQEILDNADDLARRFEEHDPELTELLAAMPLKIVYAAVQAQAAAERTVQFAVARARGSGLSWTSIAGFLGMSGEAARQKYGPHSDPD